MSELIEAFYPGWVHDKDAFAVTNEFSEILKFYVWGIPCDNVSSSSKSMSLYGWKKDVWQKAELRTYLYFRAKLKTSVTIQKAVNLSNMTGVVASVHLNGKFHLKRDANRIAFYNNGKRPDFLTVIYYIRCAIAHGRFEKYDTEYGPIYAFEAVTKKRGTNDYMVRARMMLLESTLIEWKNIILNGPTQFAAEKEKLHIDIQNSIIDAIKETGVSNKSEIVSQVPYEEDLVYAQIKYLSKIKTIEYNRSQKLWKLSNQS